MNFTVLVIGCEEIVNKVMEFKHLYQQFTFVPYIDQPNQPFSEDVNEYHAIVLANPLKFSKELLTTIEHIPVFTLAVSESTLYSSLFKCSYEYVPEQKGHYTISVDAMNLAHSSISQELSGKGIIFTEYKEGGRDQVLMHHVELWNRRHAQCVVTCDPFIKGQLEALSIPVHLIVPTHKCIKQSLNHVTEEVRQYVIQGKVETSEKIRLENPSAFQLMQDLKVSTKTLHRLQCLCYSNGKNTITASELAKGFSITLRSARRILSNLEYHRIATVIGEEQSNKRGRPRAIYRIDLQPFQEEILSNCSYH
ncbi:hypothetical protein N780_11740 [Pontibacillus chungwhensis BH030062]|uniref:Transcriptional regulator n=1 Tax=Pontibacillus chungwhensis BH030062 TaxID=1385513 RepID=A0A0A2UZD1_9BACI|nr:hypothetical protein [Pontibacillus chungwhensis]KGP93284.1 hypothetical protein N780_11740 [Pontibacillus chungwhensis BH030062]